MPNCCFASLTVSITGFFNRGPPRFCKLGIHEPDVEGRIVGNQRGISEEFQDLIGDNRKSFGAKLPQLGTRQAMDFDGTFRDVTLRIDVKMQRFPGRQQVEQFDATNLDHAIAAFRIVAGRLGVEADFPHRPRTRVVWHAPSSSKFLAGRKSTG